MIYPVSKDPGDCCLLGLGGGGIVHALIPYLNCEVKYHIDSVELDDEVIAVAKNYFYLPNIPVFNQDAMGYLQSITRQYQYILVDIFEQDPIALPCYHEEFFQTCLERLVDNGLLIVNLARARDHWSVYRKIKIIFSSNLLILPIYKTSNIIIIACKGNLFEYIATKQWRFKQKKWDTKWGLIGQVE